MGSVLQCCCYTYNPALNVSNIITDVDTEYLHIIEYKDTTVFTFPIKYGKVIKVYDGDTITIAAKLPNTDGPIYRFSVRLDGIDAPEIKGKSIVEREFAKQSRDALHQLIYGKVVELRNVANEKYGRILADVYIGDMNVNQWLTVENFAVLYDGGKKQRPVSWD